MRSVTAWITCLPHSRALAVVAASSVLLFAAADASGQVPPDATPSELLSTTLGLTVLPAKGQSREMQGADETECYFVTKARTGVDPLAKPPAAAEQRKSFDNGFRTCLESRGYTVSR